MPPLEAQIQLPQYLGVLGELLLTNLFFNIYSYSIMAEGATGSGKKITNLS